MSRWRGSKGWGGVWTNPPLLQEPVTTRERGAIVAMSNAGFAPARIAKAFDGALSIASVAGSFMNKADRALKELDALGARAVLPCDDEYPKLLREIVSPPPLLYVRGERLDMLQPCVAIVGARGCSTGGAKFAYRLGDRIACAGFTVVSGLAKGIDSAAHAGALESGKTIGVIGTGLDVVYPATTRELAPRVATQGAIVSEFPLHVGPREWHFPFRNRVIAGMSFALIVVEAGMRSGALITVGMAEDAGREIFTCITGPENPAGTSLALSRLVAWDPMAGETKNGQTQSH